LGFVSVINRNRYGEGNISPNEEEFHRVSSGDIDYEESLKPKELLLEKTKSEVDEIVEELTNIQESDDFGKVARRLLNLRKMLKNS
jgi:hypothetical protein